MLKVSKNLIKYLVVKRLVKYFALTQEKGYFSVTNYQFLNKLKICIAVIFYGRARIMILELKVSYYKIYIQVN